MSAVVRTFTVLAAVMLSLPAAALFAPVASATDPVTVCGKLQNRVGWDLAGITITFTNVQTRAQTSNTTDAHGDYVVPLDPTASYALTFQQASPGANDGAVYATPYDANYTTAPQAPAWLGGALSDFTTPGTCPGSTTSGLLYGPTNGVIQMDAPGQGFVQVTVHDAAARGAPALPGATLLVSGASSATGATGVARGVCHPGNLGEVNSGVPGQATVTPVVVQMASFTTFATSVNCSEATLASVDVALWRQPIVIATQAVDSTQGQYTQQTGMVRADANGVTGAVLSLLHVPADLDLARACGATDLPRVAAEAYTPQASSTSGAPYACTNTTGTGGLAALWLPWSGIATDPYRVQALAPDYAATFTDVYLTASELTSATAPNLDPTNVQGTSVAAAGARHVGIALTREGLVLQGVVHQVNNTPIPNATVTFSGPTAIAVHANASGAFNVTLAAGVYDVKVQQPDFSDGGCKGVHLTRSANALPSSCLALAQFNTAIVTGTLRDQNTSGVVPSFAACITATQCITTDANGMFTAQVPCATPLSLSWTDKSTWTSAVTDPTGSTAWSATSGCQQTQTLPDAFLVRAIYSTLVPNPLNATGAGVPTTVTVKQGDTVVLDKVVSGVAYPLAWTNATSSIYWPLNGTAYAEASSIRDATATDVRYNATPLGDFHVFSDGTSDIVAKALTPTFVTTINVTVMDRHTVSNIAMNVTITPCSFAPCRVQALPGTPATFSYYVDPSALTYTVSTAASDLKGVYQGSAGKSLSSANPAWKPSVTLAILRGTLSATVKTLDAHTGEYVTGDFVSVVPMPSKTFICNPDGGSSSAQQCQGSSPTSGQPTSISSLPLVNCGEAAFKIAAGPYTVLLASPNANAQVKESNVNFNETFKAICDAGPAYTLLMPRAATDVLTVTVNDANATTGTPLAGPLAVHFASARNLTSAAYDTPPAGSKGFVCAPAVDGNTTYPDCDLARGAGQTLVSYQAHLPGGTFNDHMWNVVGSAPGRFTDEFVYASATSAPSVTFSLMPTTFAAKVTLAETASPALPGPSCASTDVQLTIVDLVPGASVDLERGTATPTAPNTISATAKGCTATFQMPWDRVEQVFPAAGAGSLASPQTSDVVAITGTYGAQGTSVVAGVGQLGPQMNATSASAITAAPPNPNPFTFRVNGTVYDANGTDSTTHTKLGVSGALVKATLQGPSPCGNAEVDTMLTVNGVYNLTLTCSGTYTITATDPAGRYRNASGTVTITPSLVPTGDKTVDLTMARTTQHVTLTQLDANPFAVKAAGGAVPVSGVKLYVNDTRTGESYQATTGPDGTATLDLIWDAYTIDQHAPSAYTDVTATRALAVLPAALPAYPGALGLEASQASVTAVVVTGHVNDSTLYAAGLPSGVPGEAVRATAAGCPDALTVTSANGTYTLNVTCAGTYAITAGGPVATGAPALHALSTKPLAVAAGATGPATGPDFTLARTTGTVVVDVVAILPTAVDTSKVQLVAAEGGLALAPTAHDASTATFTAPWGAYTVTDTVPPAGYQSATMPATAAPGQSTQAALVLASTSLPVFALQGKVVDATHAGPTLNGVAGATVTATGTGACASATATPGATLPDGTFVILTTCPGTFSLATSHPLYATPAAPTSAIAATPTGAANVPDIKLARTTVTVHVTVKLVDAAHANLGGVGGVTVTAAGVDTTAAASDTTCRQGLGCMVGQASLTLPWGVTTVTIANVPSTDTAPVTSLTAAEAPGAVVDLTFVVAGSDAGPTGP